MQISRGFISFSRYRFLKMPMRSHHCGRDDCGLVVGLLDGSSVGHVIQPAWSARMARPATVGAVAITYQAIGTGHDGRGDHHRGTE